MSKPKTDSWSYGITTHHTRHRNILQDTVNSLARAGFDKPHLFLDGMDDGWSPPCDNLRSVTLRQPPVGQYMNWLMGLIHLYTHNRHCQYYAIFEDDLLCCANLRQYVEQCYPQLPTASYLNLITHDVNLVLTGGIEGWHLSNQLGKGAVGLVFNRHAIETLLRTDMVIGSSEDTCSDGQVIQRLKKEGFQEYIHFPTLIQHTGDESVLGHKWGRMKGWRGEEWNPLEITASTPERPKVDNPVKVKTDSPDTEVAKVVIPTQKPAEQLQPLIKSIIETAGMPVEVYVTGQHGSASYNRNYGLDWSDNADWICMVDDDCQFKAPGWLLPLRDAMLRPDVAFASAALYQSNGTPAYMTGLQDCGGKHQNSGEFECPTKRMLTACCVFKPRGTRFDETYIGSGFEDTDYCNQLTAKRPDDKYLVCFDSKVIHNNEKKDQLPNWPWNKLVYRSKWEPDIKLKPLVALYKVYRGGEWFGASLESIKDNVQAIVVVHTDRPWTDKVAALPENCMQPLEEFEQRHPDIPVIKVLSERHKNQGDQYRLGLKTIANEFGTDAGVLIVDSDEVWEPTQLRTLRAFMREDTKSYYFTSRLHNYIKQTNWRITPQEPHRPVVALANATVPYVAGRFNGVSPRAYKHLPLAYHHYPLVRDDETEIMHKLQNTASQDGPCLNDWFNTTWQQLPEGVNIHPARGHAACWQGVTEIDEDRLLPDTLRASADYCRLRVKQPLIEKHELQFASLPRYHRRFEQQGAITGLADLIKEAKPQLMVEVGCGSGESTEIACQLAERVWAVDNWRDDTCPAIDNPLFYQNKMMFDLRTARFDNLTVLRYNSLDAVDTFEDHSLDLVYIDAAHDADSIRADIKAWLPKVKTGGWIAGHDYVWYPAVKQVVDSLFEDVKVMDDTSWIAKVN